MATLMQNVDSGGSCECGGKGNIQEASVFYTHIFCKHKTALENSLNKIKQVKLIPLKSTNLMHPHTRGSPLGFQAAGFLSFLHLHFDYLRV